MPLKTDRVKLVVNGDADTLKKAVEDAKALMAKCAEKGGHAYVEKTGSDSLDVKCVYESGEEEPMTIELEDVKQELIDKQTLSLPPEMTQDRLQDTQKRIDEFRKFVEKCVSSGGEVRLVKDRVGEPAVEIVHAECWRVERLEKQEED